MKEINIGDKVYVCDYTKYYTGKVVGIQYFKKRKYKVKLDNSDTMVVSGFIAHSKEELENIVDKYNYDLITFFG